MEDFRNFPTFEEGPDDKQEEMVIMTPDQITELNKEFDENNEQEETSEGDAHQEETPVNENQETNEDNEEKPEEDPIAKGVYTSLVERGIFTEDEEFDGTFDTLEKYFDKLPDQSRQAILNDTPVVGKELVDYVINGGNALTNEDILEFMDKYRDTNTTSEVASIENAEEVVKAELTKLGFDDEQIELNIDLMKGKGDEVLINKAKEYQDRNKPNLEAEIARAEANRVAEENAAREFTQSVFSTLEESKFSAKRKTEIKNAIRSEQITDVLVEAVSNPASLIQLANLVLHYDKSKGFDLTEFAKQVASKDIKKMQDRAFADNFGTTASGQNREQSKDKDKFSNIEFVNP